MVVVGRARRVLERERVIRTALPAAMTGLVGLLALAASALGASRGAPVSVTVHGPVDTTSSSGWLEILPVVFQGIAVVVALPTLGAILWQVRLAARTAHETALAVKQEAVATKQERTAELQVVWVDREFRKILSRALAFGDVRDGATAVRHVRSWVRAPHGEAPALLIGSDGDGPWRVERAWERQRARSIPHPSRNDVYHVLGEIENLAIRYNEDEIDRRWADRMLGPSLAGTFEQWWWLIVFLRAHHSAPEIAVEWERMVLALASADTVTLERPQGVRIICLPPAPARASAREWSRARLLSAALAGERGQQAFRDAVAPAPAGPQAGVTWQAVVVPASIGADDEAQKRDRELRARLNERLAGITARQIDWFVGSGAVAFALRG